jgi:type II secretory pathway component GspD/PulD (secretin)
MSWRMMRPIVLALACVLAGRLAVADAGQEPEQRQPDTLTQVVYAVAELVVPIGTDGSSKPATREAQLMELIRKTVAPTSWQEQGGSGSMQYYPLGMALVVRQSPAVQAQVVDLLKALRRLQDVEVAIELRLVQMSPELAAEFRAKGGFERQGAESGKNALAASFSDKELYPWMRLFQADPATQIMMTPKLTVFNGQHSHMAVLETQSYVTEYKVARDGDRLAVVPQTQKIAVGVKCGLLPTVSADRRFVRLMVDFRQTSLPGPVATMPVTLKLASVDGEEKLFTGAIQQPHVQTLELKQRLAIPDGRTMAISLGEVMSEARTETEAPVLSRVPYLCRLVRTVGVSREQREVFLFVTPRVIVNEEEEEVFGVRVEPQPPANSR